MFGKTVSQTLTKQSNFNAPSSKLPTFGSFPYGIGNSFSWNNLFVDGFSMAIETLQVIATLGGLGAIVWRASKLQSNLEKSIENASEDSKKYIAIASQSSDAAITAAAEKTKEGQAKLQKRFEDQFDKLQEHNAESYRTLNGALQLHLRDFDHERLDRQKSEELIIKNIEALRGELEKALTLQNQELLSLRKQTKDVIGFLEKHHGFVNRDR